MNYHEHFHSFSSIENCGLFLAILLTNCLIYFTAYLFTHAVLQLKRVPKNLIMDA